MAKTASVIEINGVKYDAATGRAISKVKDFAKLKLSSSSQVIDGFVRSRKMDTARATAKTTTQKPKPKEGKSRSGVQSAKSIHSRTERSKTLVRSVVSKPSLRVKDTTKNLVKPLAREGLSSIDRKKEAVAKIIPKNPNISKYGIRGTGHHDITGPAKVGEVIATARPIKTAAPAAGKSSQSSTSLAATSSQHLERLLDAALFSATSHREEYRKTKKIKLLPKNTPKWLKIFVTSLVVVVIAFLFAWRTIPYVSVKIVGLTANIATTSPSYTPTGFNYVGPASNSGGVISIEYRSKYNQAKNYQITQQKSALDSATLGTNITGTKSNVLTSQVNGNTIYIYGTGNDAAWVSGGLQYAINNHAELTSDQLLSIIASM